MREFPLSNTSKSFWTWIPLEVAKVSIENRTGYVTASHDITNIIEKTLGLIRGRQVVIRLFASAILFLRWEISDEPKSEIFRTLDFQYCFLSYARQTLFKILRDIT